MIGTVMTCECTFQMSSGKEGGKGGGKGVSKGGGKVGVKVTRSAATVFDFDSEFPPMKTFTPSNKLPDYLGTVGVLRYLLEGRGRGVTVRMACLEVSKHLLAKYFHDNVYHKSLDSVSKMVFNVYKIYMDGKHRQAQGRLESEAYRLFVELYQKKKKLFDIYPDRPERIVKCQEEWGDLRMTDRDKEYYEDMKEARLMCCENRCDPTFYMTWIKQQRQEEAKKTWDAEKEQLFRFRGLEEIKKLLIERGEEDDSRGEEDTGLQGDGQGEQGAGQEEVVQIRVEEADNEPEKKKKKYEAKNDDGDRLPVEVRHIRVSERQVRPEFYQTCAALSGLGLSLPEAAAAVVVVGNRMFGRSWRNHYDMKTTYDCDTVPTARNIRTALQLQEVEGMARIVEEVEEGKGQMRSRRWPGIERRRGWTSWTS